MARLQDFPTVTPTSSDKLLVVQSQSQGLVPYDSKLDSANPTGTGSLSLNRKANTTVGNYSVAIGYNTTASGDYSFAEGVNGIASGARSHSEGSATTASGSFSHSEGRNSTAIGQSAHAEGDTATASGNFSHAEGYSTTASGSEAHAEGNSTTAEGVRSHAEGSGTTASGQASHAEGSGTIANHAMQHVFGQYNVADTSSAPATSAGNYIEIVGKGSGDANRSNARTLDWSGNEVLAGDLTYNGNVSLASMLMSYSLSSSSSVTLTNVRYTSLIIIGFAQGIGDVAILLTVGSGAISSTINLKTGAAFSSTHLTFSLSGQTLTISSDVAQASILTIIRGN